MNNESWDKFTNWQDLIRGTVAIALSLSGGCYIFITRENLEGPFEVILYFCCWLVLFWGTDALIERHSRRRR